MESAPVSTETTETSDAFRLTVRSWKRWPSVVERIQAGDPAGFVELYEMLRDGFYGHLWRQLGPQDLEDRIQDVYLIVSERIKRGEVREPERLPGYVATVVRRLAAQEIERRVLARRRTAEILNIDFFSDNEPNPEELLAKREELEVACRLMAGMKPAERELLSRYYLRGQRPKEVMQAMGLTATTFRVDKTRYLAKFRERGEALLRHTVVAS